MVVHEFSTRSALAIPSQEVLLNYINNTRFWLTTLFKSRACAAALSTVSRTTSLSSKNIRFSGSSRTKIPRPIVMKVCRFDYVVKTTKRAKNGHNRLTRRCYRYTLNISISFSCNFLQNKPLACTVAQTTWYDSRKCLQGCDKWKFFPGEFPFS
jgi:hypothetical protein